MSEETTDQDILDWVKEKANRIERCPHCGRGITCPHCGKELPIDVIRYVPVPYYPYPVYPGPYTNPYAPPQYPIWTTVNTNTTQTST